MVNRKTKDSKIGWIGEVPHNWKIVRVKSLFEIGRGRVIAKTELKDDGKYPVYSSQTKDNGILGYINSYDYEQDQLTWTTDGANAGTVFLRRGKYNCTNVCGTLRPMKKEINLNYMLYALEHIAHYHKRADTNGFKIMSNEMAAIKITFPPLSEQQKIASFLDEKVAHIDNILEDTKKSIEYLKAYKKSLITETVTKGLNANVEMKDSGIEWIGEIPKHWRLSKVKNFVYIRNGKDYRVKEGEVPVYGSGGAFGSTNQIMYDKPSVLLGRKGTIDSPKYVVEPFWAVDTTFYTIVKPNVNLKYFYYAMKSFDYKKYIYGSAIPSMSQSILNEIKIPYMDIIEQTRIAKYLDDKILEIDSLIEQKVQLLTEFETYKKSFIYEYVTGKKEVQ